MKQSILTMMVLLLAGATGQGSVKETHPETDAPAIMKALPIYSNDLIDSAPDGETVTGIRDCYTSCYEGGLHVRRFEQGVLGEYVMGTDGNIYLRAVCYEASKISPKTDTYLKLEKVDDRTYVAHTPQLIWVDELDDGSIFTAYATRVVFSQKSATSFGYEVQENPDGSYDTDVYFTLEDGKLRQSNMNTTEMNEEIFPEELLGFTTSAGNWIGFGDGCIQIFQPSEKPVTLPESATVNERSMAYTLLHVRDIELDDATLLKYAENGDEIYISNPSAKTEQWIRGSIDRENGTATFRKQYLGIDEESGYAVWFLPTEYSKYLEVLNEETGFGDWFRRYAPIDEITLDYKDGVLMSRKGQALCFSHSPETVLLTGVYADPSIKDYVAESVVPAPVTFTKYEGMDDIWGFGVIGFAIPSMSEEGVYIDTDELYYNVFPDGSDTPFVFTPDDYYDMQVDSMTDVPYGYFEDFDFRVSGVNHTLYFYHDWKKVGVQVIQKHNGVETRSRIIYAGETGGVDSVYTDTPAANVYKYIDNGEVIIVRDGKKYNALGYPVND